MSNDKLKFSDRCYWFSRNLVNLVLCLLVFPIYSIWFITLSIAMSIYVTFFTTDGSSTLSPPWQWKWWDLD